jgi:hypothetical protein
MVRVGKGVGGKDAVRVRQALVTRATRCAALVLAAAIVVYLALPAGRRRAGPEVGQGQAVMGKKDGDGVTAAAEFAPAEPT